MGGGVQEDAGCSLSITGQAVPMAMYSMSWQLNTCMRTPCKGMHADGNGFVAGGVGGGGGPGGVLQAACMAPNPHKALPKFGMYTQGAQHACHRAPTPLRPALCQLPDGFKRLNPPHPPTHLPIPPIPASPVTGSRPAAATPYCTPACMASPHLAKPRQRGDGAVGKADQQEPAVAADGECP